MILSLIFSVVVYQMSANEVEFRLDRFQTNIQQSRNLAPPIPIERFRIDELNNARSNLAIRLIYVNIFVLIGGGFISYFLARRSIIPIEKAHEEQSRFTSDASHELRTPLAIMKTELEVAINDKSTNTKELKQILISNLEEVNRLSKLADMLLSLSQIEKAKLDLTPIDLNKIAIEVSKSFGINSDRIELTTDNQPKIINGNDTAIYDLIKILVDNAVIYSTKNSPIKIVLSSNNELVKLEIINKGPGITANKMPYIFDRFYRADASRTSGDKKGYGLGLALAKKIVDLHDGKIVASSVTDDITTFTVILSSLSQS